MCAAQVIELLAMIKWDSSDSKVHGANMGPIWGRQDPGGPYVDPMNFAIWDLITPWEPHVEKQ